MKTKDLLEFMRITHLLCIILVVITISSGRAQTGSPFITNIPLDKIGNALITDICSDEENVMIFTSNKSLFTYDGDLFSKIKTPAIPSLLFRDDQTAKIYVACYNSIGYIKKDSQCMYQFVSIADDTEDVFEILKAREKIFFIADKKIFVYDKASAKMTTIKSDKMLGFAWQSKETIYLQTSSNEILYLKDTAIKAWTGMLDEQILFATKQSEDKIILGTSKNKLYTFTDNSVQQLKIKDSLFLSENYIVDAIPYTENEIVISTDIGGAVLLNLQRGEIKQYMNYYTGLPDDEILAFGKDRDNGIWISHLQGISRVDFSVPIQCFSTYKGLEGNISDIIEYNKTLYVTTSEGVYKLERFEDVERKEVFKNVIKQVAVSTENNSKRLSFLRKRNKKTEYTTQMVRVAELSQAIRSVSYNYKRIKDISDKCHQIVAFDGGLVVGGNNGLYYIKNGKTEILIENTYIHTVSVSQFNPKQLYCGTNKGLFVINTKFASNVQIYIHHINTLKTKSIVSIVEQRENELWLGSENNAYKLTKENGGDWVIVPFGSQTIFQAVYGFIYDGKVFFYNDETVYEPNEETKELQESQKNFLTDIDLFYPNFNLPFVKKQGNYMFAASGAQITIDKYLHLFGEITRIIPQPDGRYWFVNNSKGIYHLNPKNEKAEEPLPLYLKYIRNRNIYIQIEEPIKLEFADNSLLFSFFSPYYLKTNDIKYSYRISEHDSIWSDWKKQGEIDIRFIPPGDYSLEVKAHNSLGVMGKSQIYTFSVLKPFTQTPLFYLLLLSCTAGLVVFTVKLRLRKLKNDKIILEQKIQKRTVTIENQN